MKRLKKDIVLRCVKVLSLLLIVAAYAGSWYGYYADHLLHPYYRKGNLVFIALFAVIYIFLARVYEAYMISTNRVAETIYSQILSFMIADGVMYIVTWLVNKLVPNVIPLLITFAAQIVITVFWSLLAHAWYFKSNNAKSTIIVYDEKSDFHQLIEEYGYDKKFDVRKILPIDECLDNLDILKDTETVFLTDIHSHERNAVLKYCIQNGITVYVLPRIGDVLMSGARSMHLFHLPVMRVARYHPTPEYTIIKRSMDILLSIIGLVVFSPAMGVIALAIKLEDRGPVFYKQKRLTRNGKVFEVIKFRSMIVNAEDDGVARLSAGVNDDRITKVGKVIRKIRFDEIPQFINILKGDMSFVGPRPERPEIAAQYEEVIPEFSLRLQTKAGLTGYAQVYGKYNTTPYNKLELDLQYIAHSSILEDLRILLATVKILFVPESTDGIGNTELTALEEQRNSNDDWDLILKKYE